jgi:hypothetical protein
VAARTAEQSKHGIFPILPRSLNLIAGDPGFVHGSDKRLHEKTFLAAGSLYMHALQLLSRDAEI